MPSKTHICIKRNHTPKRYLKIDNSNRENPAHQVQRQRRCSLFQARERSARGNRRDTGFCWSPTSTVKKGRERERV